MCWELFLSQPYNFKPRTRERGKLLLRIKTTATYLEVGNVKAVNSELGVLVEQKERA